MGDLTMPPRNDNHNKRWESAHGPGAPRAATYAAVLGALVLAAAPPAAGDPGSCDPQEFYVAEDFVFASEPDFTADVPPRSGIVIDTFQDTFAVFLFVEETGSGYKYLITGRLGDMCP